MPLTPFDLDPESLGSRFTLHPVVVVYGRFDHAEDDRRPDETRRVALFDALGPDILAPKPGLGAGEVIRASIGRGGEGAAVAVQWMLLAAIGGVIGGAAYEGARRAGEALKGVLRGSEEHPKVAISRGAAALFALDAVTGLAPATNSLLIEAVEEPTSIAGYHSPEINYVDIEPWLVFLVDFDKEVRHIVTLSAQGEILGHMSIPLQPSEADYHPGRRRHLNNESESDLDGVDEQD